MSKIDNTRSCLLRSEVAAAGYAALIDIPTELQIQILTHLPYPDLLALKLTCTYFHTLVRTRRHDRVSWLLSRACNTPKPLPLPEKTRCSWRTDREFVSNAEVRAILLARRAHTECVEYGQGKCLVVGSGLCSAVRKWGPIRVACKPSRSWRLVRRAEMMSRLVQKVTANIYGQVEILRASFAPVGWVWQMCVGLLLATVIWHAWGGGGSDVGRIVPC